MGNPAAVMDHLCYMVGTLRKGAGKRRAVIIITGYIITTLLAQI